mmetsp:Transcript_18772/g.38588  ORF Transcript_18772/g.38588 Transcript_18772/m.38588 type:complete len:98 (-) Transcript_18772:46-339(-)
MTVLRLQRADIVVSVIVDFNFVDIVFDRHRFNLKSLTRTTNAGDIRLDSFGNFSKMHRVFVLGGMTTFPSFSKETILLHPVSYRTFLYENMRGVCYD